ncbi:30S ribosomal protein S20 [Allofustis seminis]|uniref:30S ribosomal protein S20 n=1 Tax=Allofustis seminis TaxID=166939 RepID=UPI00036A0816|nr:30S ribosomal protein S20 [Allofustis seminis]
MANSPQAIKRVRQIDARRDRQRGQETAVRTAVKKAKLAVAEGSENAEELVKNAARLLDKAVSKDLIHKNKAARMKSRLQSNL